MPEGRENGHKADEDGANDVALEEDQAEKERIQAEKERIRAEHARRNAESLRKTIEKGLDPHAEDKLQFAHLVRLHRGQWTREDPAEAATRELAEDLLEPARVAFKRHDPKCELGLFGVGGVYLSGDMSRLTISWLFQQIKFDSSEARTLVNRIDAISDAALEWWPDPTPGESLIGSGRVGRAVRWLRRVWVRLARGPARSPQAERAPHLHRAYELATSVLAAATNENERHRDTEEQTGESNPDSVSDQYIRILDQISSRIKHAEGLLHAAGQRSAQARYGRGMFWGAAMVAVLTILVGVVFYLLRVKAQYGIALPAGGLGAIMSVLQRMSSRRLALDLEMSGNLAVFGAVRPFVGATFGFVVVGLLQADLLTVAPHAGSKLALFGVLAFFAGFNERFAQDTLSSSIPTSRQER